MGRFLTTTALILAAGLTAGCNQCMQSGYYDPCAGVVYGPSVNPPSFLSGFGKSKHEAHSCPLCTSDAPPTPYGTAVNGVSSACCDHSAWTATTNYGAAFGQPVPNQTSRHASCACPSPQNCATGCAGRRHSAARHSSGCNCHAAASPCDVCSACPHEMPITNCDTCSTIGESYPGVVYDESFPAESYSSEPMILPGETIYQGGTVVPETFSHPENCPHCQATTGPIFNGTIIPGHEADKPLTPTPAPAAEPAKESAPGETVTPEPDVLPPTTMMIPTFPAPKPARQVHWVPNTLK